MANRGGPTFQKRAREKARMEKQQKKQQDKAGRREATKARKEAIGPRLPGEEDPEIAAIRPGPQPIPIEWQDLEDLEDTRDNEEGSEDSPD